MSFWLKQWLLILFFVFASGKCINDFYDVLASITNISICYEIKDSERIRSVIKPAVNLILSCFEK